MKTIGLCALVSFLFSLYSVPICGQETIKFKEEIVRKKIPLYQPSFYGLFGLSTLYFDQDYDPYIPLIYWKIGLIHEGVFNFNKHWGIIYSINGAFYTSFLNWNVSSIQILMGTRFQYKIGKASSDKWLYHQIMIGELLFNGHGINADYHINNTEGLSLTFVGIKRRNVNVGFRFLYYEHYEISNTNNYYNVDFDIKIGYEF